MKDKISIIQLKKQFKTCNKQPGLLPPGTGQTFTLKDKEIEKIEVEEWWKGPKLKLDCEVKFEKLQNGPNID